LKQIEEEEKGNNSVVSRLISNQKKFQSQIESVKEDSGAIKIEESTQKMNRYKVDGVS